MLCTVINILLRKTLNIDLNYLIFFYSFRLKNILENEIY